MILAAIYARPWLETALVALCALAFTMNFSVRILALFCLLTHRSSLASAAPAATNPPHWPTYTILIALNSEVAIASQIVAAMNAIDYPKHKTQIIFALEADDEPTIEALIGTGLAAHMQILIVPAGTPRTKPRALCYALTYATGDYVVVYDAEDIPDPDQLKRAVAAFAIGGPRLGCLQARLAVDNAASGPLTAQFAIEYIVLFEAILPALSHYGLPVPLGGTSNHFPRAVLEAIGGWDPWNVTEDADLGVRLNRLGWQTQTLASTTWEEAPVKWRDWRAQRTRWHKGWLQTYIVHMRDPRRLGRDLGALRWIWFHAIIAGGLFSALIHPWFYALLLYHVLVSHLSSDFPQPANAWSWTIAIVCYGASLSTIIGLSLLSLKRTGRSDLIAASLLAPLYWLVISIAAHRAVFQYVVAPFRWEKTPHVGKPNLE